MSIKVTRTDISFQNIENRRMSESPIKPVDKSREASAVQITEKTRSYLPEEKEVPVDRRKGDDRRRKDRRQNQQNVLLDTRQQQERRQKDRRQHQSAQGTPYDLEADQDENKPRGPGIDVLA